MVRPKYINAKNWFSSLAVDYPNEQLPVLKSNKDWFNIASLISNRGDFKTAKVLSPAALGLSEDNEEDWVKWAEMCYLLMLPEL